MATDRLNNLLSMDNEETIISLPINKLDAFPDSPFKIYDGDKKLKLIDSIKDNGVMFPIIVVPKPDSRGRYTILSGSNRVDACKQLNHEEIKAIVKHDLTEEEAMLIVIETNLFNRSIDDMLPSELAKSLALRQKALKQQGKRNDLTSGTICQKTDTYEILNEEYKLSERNIRNYIRLTYLCDGLLTFIDNNVIPFSAGVELSYLKDKEQNLLYGIITSKNYRISIDKATELKNLSKNIEEDLTIEQIEEVFKSKPKSEKKITTIKIPIKDIKSYIKEEDLSKAKDIVIEALKMYYELNN